MVDNPRDIYARVSIAGVAAVQSIDTETNPDTEIDTSEEYSSITLVDRVTEKKYLVYISNGKMMFEESSV